MECGHTWTWQSTHAWGHMVAWVYGVGLIHDTNSYARVQRTMMAWVQTTLNLMVSVTYYLKIHNANFAIDVNMYQVKLLLFCNVQRPLRHSLVKFEIYIN